MITVNQTRNESLNISKTVEDVKYSLFKRSIKLNAANQQWNDGFGNEQPENVCRNKNYH